MHSHRALFAAPVAIALFAVCAGPGTGAAASPPSPAVPGVIQDTAGMIPAGFGSLHQEDISISASQNGLTIRAVPLDEGILRTLASDSYQSLVRQRESKRAELDAIMKRTGMRSLSVWMVSFNNVQQGEAQIAPRDAVLNNQNRDFKPIDVLGITPGFGDYRVRQRQTAVALLVFDGAINVNQPLTLTLGSMSSGDVWSATLQRIEGERARIRSRASGAGRGASW